MTDRDDYDTILTMLAEGHGITKVARLLEIGEDEVRAALAATVANFRNGEHLQRVWSLEDYRLGRLGAKFFKEAMNTEGATAYQAAVAYCRISSRRAELCGANAPISHAVTPMQAAAPPKLTSTQRAALAIEHAKGNTHLTEDDIRRQWGGDSADDQDEPEQQRPQGNTRIRAAIDRIRARSLPQPADGNGAGAEPSEVH
jgi:hypothetical protein